MKVLQENPLTKALHTYWRAKIKQDLPGDSPYLCSIKYLNASPEKFYSREALNVYLEFLKEAAESDQTLLANIVNGSEQELNVAHKVLSEINQLKIHDCLVPGREIELIDFIDTKIHFSLLKLYESCLHAFLYVVVKYKRKRHNKGVDGLDLFNVIDDLKNSEFSFVHPLYHNTLRNGIAHGKVVFGEFEIVYTDKKGNSEQLTFKEVIKIFDQLIDILNAFSLAIKIFFSFHLSQPRIARINIPKAVLIEELKIVCAVPGWRILNCFESIAIGNKKQLTIYVRNNNWDRGKVNWYCFFTAYWAEVLTTGYERIFISLDSSPSLPGWAAFDGTRLKHLREQNVQNIQEYAGVLENGSIQFVPKVKFPGLLLKFGTYRNAFLLTLSLHKEKKRDSKHFLEVRDASFHLNGFSLVVADSSIVIHNTSRLDSVKLIYYECAGIVKKVVWFARNKASLLSRTKLARLKFIRISIYDSDMRVRDLRYSGLPANLIATIQVIRSEKMKVPDLINSEVEQKGMYRIFWNRNWHGLADLKTEAIQ